VDFFYWVWYTRLKNLYLNCMSYVLIALSIIVFCLEILTLT